MAVLQLDHLLSEDWFQAMSALIAAPQTLPLTLSQSFAPGMLLSMIKCTNIVFFLSPFIKARLRFLLYFIFLLSISSTTEHSTSSAGDLRQHFLNSKLRSLPKSVPTTGAAMRARNHPGRQERRGRRSWRNRRRRPSHPGPNRTPSRRCQALSQALPPKQRTQLQPRRLHRC